MSRALLRYIRLSPTKARLIAREVQGMNAELAIASLEFTPNKAARVISKVIASAVANGGYDAQDVIVTSCRVDAGPVLRRFMPRAKGRATPIRKPTAHILVEVGSAKAAKASKADSKKADSKAESQAPKAAKKAQDSKPKAESKAPKTESKPKAETKPKAKTTKPASAEKKPATKKKSEGEE